MWRWARAVCHRNCTEDLETFCSVLVCNQELPFRPSGFVVMNGEESLWGNEGAPYKPNPVAETSHHGKAQLNPTPEQWDLSCREGWGVLGAHPTALGPRQRERDPAAARFSGLCCSHVLSASWQLKCLFKATNDFLKEWVLDKGVPLCPSRGMCPPQPQRLWPVLSFALEWNSAVRKTKSQWAAGLSFHKGIVVLVFQELILYGLRSGSSPCLCQLPQYVTVMAAVTNSLKTDQIQYGKRSLLKILYIKGLTTFLNKK